eukprot:6157277-Pyramimonas_sp.AAC.1
MANVLHATHRCGCVHRPASDYSAHLNVGTTAIAADLDGDGDLDLLWLPDNDSGSPRLLVNDGSAFFTEVTDATMLHLIASWGDAVVADFDNDGDLDIYLTSRP